MKMPVAGFATVVAFSGTRKGMTDQQKVALKAYLLSQKEGGCLLIHGGAWGADTEAHVVAVEAGYAIGIVPASPYHGNLESVEWILEPEAPLKRNRRIVNCSQQLIATPAGFEEELRSGTWATVRYAARAKVPTTVVWPNGELLGRSQKGIL